mmetsp:Transcript_30113/g.80369  ORF Transcript_30113/g.80369 Transcript_30113/m.80369 type:complete len:348 (+) Transcript_30113:708-1751(+)
MSQDLVLSLRLQRDHIQRADSSFAHFSIITLKVVRQDSNCVGLQHLLPPPSVVPAVPQHTQPLSHNLRRLCLGDDAQAVLRHSPENGHHLAHEADSKNVAHSITRVNGHCCKGTQQVVQTQGQRLRGREVGQRCTQVLCDDLHHPLVDGLLAPISEDGDGLHCFRRVHSHKLVVAANQELRETGQRGSCRDHASDLDGHLGVPHWHAGSSPNHQSDARDNSCGFSSHLEAIMHEQVGRCSDYVRSRCLALVLLVGTQVTYDAEGFDEFVSRHRFVLELVNQAGKETVSEGHAHVSALQMTIDILKVGVSIAEMFADDVPLIATHEVLGGRSRPWPRDIHQPQDCSGT